MSSPENERIRALIYAYHALLGEVRDDVIGIGFEYNLEQATFVYYCKTSNEDVIEMADEIDTEFQANFYSDAIESGYRILVTNTVPDIRSPGYTLLYLKHRSLKE